MKFYNESVGRTTSSTRFSGIAHRQAKKSVARRIAAIALMIMKTNKAYDDHHDERIVELQGSDQDLHSLSILRDKWLYMNIYQQ